jgi:hypothetical protein
VKQVPETHLIRLFHRPTQCEVPNCNFVSTKLKQNKGFSPKTYSLTVDSNPSISLVAM